jgi:hypothetical protein
MSSVFPRCLSRLHRPGRTDGTGSAFLVSGCSSVSGRPGTLPTSSASTNPLFLRTGLATSDDGQNRNPAYCIILAATPHTHTAAVQHRSMSERTGSACCLSRYASPSTSVLSFSLARVPGPWFYSVYILCCNPPTRTSDAQSWLSRACVPILVGRVRSVQQEAWFPEVLPSYVRRRGQACFRSGPLHLLRTVADAHRSYVDSTSNFFQASRSIDTSMRQYLTQCP